MDREILGEEGTPKFVQCDRGSHWGKRWNGMEEGIKGSCVIVSEKASIASLLGNVI